MVAIAGRWRKLNSGSLGVEGIDMSARDLFNSEAYQSFLNEQGFAFAKQSSDPLAFGLICRPTVYKAISSDGSLEYFVLLGRDIKRRRDFVGAFGIRNEKIDRFSYSCMVKFGPEPLKLWWSKNPPDFDFYCALLRTFYRLEFDGRAVPVIYKVSHFDRSGLVTHVSFVVREKILPLVRSNPSLNDLLETLAGDANPWRWDLSNPISRASQIIATSLHLGLSLSRVRDLLRPHAQRIIVDLNPSSVSREMESHCIDRFIEQVAQRWIEYTIVR